MSLSRSAVRIIGAGPTGALLAILLQRRGFPVELYESRADTGQGPGTSGRSINLALADRGIHALQAAGVFAELAVAMLPMRGRLIHSQDGSTSLQLYGQRPHEVIYSVSRHQLNRLLLEAAARQSAVSVHFEHRFENADFHAGTAQFRDLRRNRLLEVPMQPMLATDGAGSLMRRRMRDVKIIEAHETDLEHGYKELSIPPDAGGNSPLARDALHIWPRGNHMLIALPNTDGSFTATLFLPGRGPVSFASISEPAEIERFLSESFPDARELMPNCVAEFQNHPVGFLGSIDASPWHYRGMTALIGDAAHAMVPFHGQGMNCCFEDCLEFDAGVDRHSSWDSLFAEFGAVRKPNTDAITAMALENYAEMRERVADAKFQLQQALSLELERRHPRRFIPRYSMVMFHHEIPYRTALLRGAVQAEILDGLTAHGVRSLADVDFERADREITARLEPLSYR